MTLYTRSKRIAKESVIKPQIGDYVRTKDGLIAKYISYDKTYECHRFDGNIQWFYEYYTDDIYDEDWEDFLKEQVVKSSQNITDLIEYMDLLWLKHPIKLYDSKLGIGLFNPVRCDGFTEFDDGTHCIILNLDYLVNLKDLKISGIITHEKIESMKYKIGE